MSIMKKLIPSNTNLGDWKSTCRGTAFGAFCNTDLEIVNFSNTDLAE